MVSTPLTIADMGGSLCLGNIEDLETVAKQRRGPLKNIQSTPEDDRVRCPRHLMAVGCGEETLYDVLGARVEDDYETLKRNYRRLSVQLHPDKNSSATTDAFLRLQKAWETLRDEDARQDYDRTLTSVEDVAVWMEVPLNDLSTDDADALFTYDCRCGGTYEVDADEVDANADLLVPCDGCSYYIRIKR